MNEEQMAKRLSPLKELLGEERVDKLKDRICDLIIERVRDDINDWYIIEARDVWGIVNEVLHKEVKPMITKRLTEQAEEILKEKIALGVLVNEVR